MKHKRIKLIILVCVLFFAAGIPLIDKSPYHLDVLISVMMNALLAMTFIILLRTGLLSLGIAAFWGLGSYSSAILSTKLHLSVWLCFPLSGITTGVIAFLLGFVLLRNTGFSFVMLTAVIGMLFSVVVGNVNFLGGYYGIANIPSPAPIRLLFGTIDFSSKEPWYFLILIMLCVLILIITAFNSAWTGRAWQAIGMNRRLAGFMGINVFRYKMTAFVLASSIAGVVGSFYAHYLTFIIPDTYGIWQVVYIQIYAILGGIGHLFAGPLVGSIIITIFPEMVRQVQNMGQIFIGILLIVLVMALPNGLLSIPQTYPRISTWISLIYARLAARFNRSEQSG